MKTERQRERKREKESLPRYVSWPCLYVTSQSLNLWLLSSFSMRLPILVAVADNVNEGVREFGCFINFLALLGNDSSN